MNTLPDRLKQLRIESNLLQKDIAKKLNITSSAYGFYEQGKRIPDSNTLNSLANFYNVSTDYILGRTDIKELNTSAVSISTFIPKLTKKDEKDIAKKLEEVLDSMNSNEELLLYNSSLDDETRELLIASIERTLRQAKLISKEKYTPIKYRK